MQPWRPQIRSQGRASHAADRLVHSVHAGARTGCGLFRLSLGEALQICEQSPTAWVIGGAQIYAQALPLARRIEVTEIDQNFVGDAFAPSLGSEWTETARTRHVSADGLPFSFVTLVRA
ncbi:dihydrofolate reductase [Brachymonas sp. M4Q-1]|uniref:dihydrofolate reductase n=1 Tax=Brachymonas sp. M4Q-1 TaxID=3416906 RepID=UPI003CEEDE17